MLLSKGISIRFAEKMTGEWDLNSKVIASTDRKEAWSIGAVSGFDVKGTTFALGANGYSEENPRSGSGWARGSLYLHVSDNTGKDMNWDSFRIVKKEEEDLDQLGSTLCISSDGAFTIAESFSG